MKLVPQFLSFVYEHFVLEVPCFDLDHNASSYTSSGVDIFYGAQVTTFWSRNGSLEMDPCEHIHQEDGQVARITYQCPEMRASWRKTLAAVECRDTDTLLWWLEEVYQDYCNGILDFKTNRQVLEFFKVIHFPFVEY